MRWCSTAARARHPRIRSSRAGRLHAVDRAAGADAGPAPSHRMGAADVRHDRVPKMVVHDARRAHRRHRRKARPMAPTVWGTFYDIRRYGGLQIFLRALLGGASLVLSSAEETGRATSWRGWRAHGVTHMSGTPSHWRRALMSPAVRRHRAALRASVGRDRRPGDPGQPARLLSARRDRPCLSPRPKPAWLSKSPTASKAFPPT